MFHRRIVESCVEARTYFEFGENFMCELYNKILFTISLGWDISQLLTI